MTGTGTRRVASLPRRILRYSYLMSVISSGRADDLLWLDLITPHYCHDSRPVALIRRPVKLYTSHQDYSAKKTKILGPWSP